MTAPLPLLPQPGAAPDFSRSQTGRRADGSVTVSFGQELFDAQRLDQTARPEALTRPDRRDDNDTARDRDETRAASNNTEVTAERADTDTTETDDPSNADADRPDSDEASEATSDEQEGERDAAAKHDGADEDAAAPTGHVNPDAAATVIPQANQANRGKPAIENAAAPTTTNPASEAPAANQPSIFGASADSSQGQTDGNATGDPNARAAQAVTRTAATETTTTAFTPTGTSPTGVATGETANATPSSNATTNTAPASNTSAALNAPTDQDTDAVNTARLSRGLRTALNQQGGAVTLRLTPPEMGTVRIQLDLSGTAVTARFHAESDAARSLLQQQLGQLRTALEGQGLSVDRLSVQSMTQGSGAQLTDQNADGSNGDGRSRGQYQSASQHRDSSGDDARDADDFRDLFAESETAEPGEPTSSNA